MAARSYGQYCGVTRALELVGERWALLIVRDLLVGPRRYNKVKLDAYECGIQPSPQAAAGGRIPVKFYTTAMLFVIFDVEAVFLYPFAVAFDQLGLFALLAMVLFLVNAFFIADAYVWRRGGLEWD